MNKKGENLAFSFQWWGASLQISELALLRSVSQKSLQIVCCVCLMDTTCPYGAVAMELSCFESWQVACISRVDVDMQCCSFLLAKDLMPCWHCWSWTSTRCLSQCFCQVSILTCKLHYNNSWVSNVNWFFFFPLLFVIQHLQVTDRDGAIAPWCLKHSNILMYLIISRMTFTSVGTKIFLLHFSSHNPVQKGLVFLTVG